MPDAIILAGPQYIRNSDSRTNKALLCINGKMMVEYVIDALKKAAKVDRVVIVGPGKELEEGLKDKVDAVVDSAGSIMENLTAGIRYLGLDRPVMVCTSDIPMITPEAVDDFLAKCEVLKADLCYPIVEKKINEQKFPYIERTYVKISEGIFTGGNIFYLNPAVIEKTYSFAETLLSARKKPLKMARLLSMGLLFQLLLGTLSLNRIEKRFSEITGIKAKAVISQFPEIGNDVDKPSDVIAASTYLSG